MNTSSLSNFTSPSTRKWLIIAVIVLQVIVLAYMAGEREWIRAHGKHIFLRTAPIDPRDPLRGDFVRLRYELNSVRLGDIRGDTSELSEKKGRRIYAVLKPQGNDVYELDYYSAQQPEQGVFLKGRTTNDWRYLRDNVPIGAKFGIEQLFVEQYSGKAIEEKRGGWRKMQVPMEVEIAVGNNGTALIDDYRWSQLGIQIEVVRSNRKSLNNEVEDPDLPLSPKVRVSLQNVSEQALSLVNDDNNCGFTLSVNDWSTKSYPLAVDTCGSVAITADQLVSLAPMEIYSVEIDLSDERWHVSDDGKIKEVGELLLSTQLRLSYQSPDPEQINHLTFEAPTWIGRLPSQSFNAIGIVD